MRRAVSAAAVISLAGALGAGGAWALTHKDPDRATGQGTASTVSTTVSTTASTTVSAGVTRGTASSADSSDAAVTVLPGLKAASGEPTLPGLRQGAPTSGTVGWISGPFDDRFNLTRLRFDGRRVSGEIDITSDVSDLLELQVLTGWYDARGRLVGTARFVHHGEHAGGPHVDAQGAVTAPEETWPFTVRVPARLQGRVVTASVGVPVLVNE